MKSISAFSFAHNLLDGGYPICEAIEVIRPFVDEVVIVDMESTDGTRDLLEKLNVKILDGQWTKEAGKTLRQAHSMYNQCFGDIILHFESDEVFHEDLIRTVVEKINQGFSYISVLRLQLEQNFQRCRWYPEYVHRVWPKNDLVKKEGHTTKQKNHKDMLYIGASSGFLFDCTNCFRNNWIKRICKQAELRREQSPNYSMVQHHANLPWNISDKQAKEQLNELHWLWKRSPFDLPRVLKSLVGQTEYKSRL